MAAMMTGPQWDASVRIWRAAGAAQDSIEAAAIGCPWHGNASMDIDSDGPYCSACDRSPRDGAGYVATYGA